MYGLLSTKIKDQIQNTKIESLVKFPIVFLRHIKTSVIPHEYNIYQTAYYMAMAIMYAYPPSQCEFPHWKCVLRCCLQFLHIDIPSQKWDNHHSNACPTINFCVYNLFTRFMVNGRRLLDKNHNYLLCISVPESVPNEKLYTRKYIVLIGTHIADFHTSFYIP